MKTIHLIALLSLFSIITSQMTFLPLGRYNRNKEATNKKSKKQINNIPMNLITIARNLNGGCGSIDDTLDCVVDSPDRLSNLKNSFGAQGIDFEPEHSEMYGAVYVKHYSFDDGSRGYNVQIRTCATSIYEYHLDKIDTKINIISDETCRDEPYECYQKTEACDDSDCLASPKKAFKQSIPCSVLDEYKPLYPDSVAKSDWKRINDALHQLKNVLHLDALNSKCQITIAQCMSMVISKGTAAQPDIIHQITKPYIENILNNC